MTDVTVVEGQVRLRDGKKWKSRWVTFRKPSPVADCLVLQVQKDGRERWSLTLEDICGLEPGLAQEGVAYTLSVVCLSQAVVLGFDSKEALLAWDIRLCYSLGEVHRFGVGVLPGTKLESGPATLHLCNSLLVITRDFPPAVIGQWNLPDLRRYGAVPNGFVFEGGTRCGYWAGVFFLSCMEGEQISFLFDCMVRGISPSRAPFGLRPALPDLSASPAYLEEQLNLEAQDLEKRLSLLSHHPQHSSTASDDRSISSSSDTSDSQSDASMGSRLAVWVSPAPAELPVEAVVTEMAPGSGNASGTVRGVVCPPPPPPRPRGLQETGRQSSTDSGIATASHSSYSGSFSSYAGSLGDDPASLSSDLPPNAVPQTVPPCSCPQDPEPWYQVPSSLRSLYDRPRSLLLGPARGPNLIPPKDQATPAPLSPRPAGGSRDTGETSSNPSSTSPAPERQGQAPGAPPSADGPLPPWDLHTPLPAPLRALLTACPVCGGLKGTTASHAGLSPVSAVTDKNGRRRENRRKAEEPYEVMEGQGVDKTVQCEENSSYGLMAHRGQQKIALETEGPMCAEGQSVRTKPLREHTAAVDPKESYELMASSFDAPKRCDLTREDFGGGFVLPADTAVPDRCRGDGVTYVNIPVSPSASKQLHYMELELQEPLSGVRGAGNSKYALIDIAVTETAHRVGAQHALCREERLQDLQQKKRGALQ